MVTPKWLIYKELVLLTDRALELAPSELGKTIEPFNFHGLQFFAG
jgi:hypothetical protein